MSAAITCTACNSAVTNFVPDVIEGAAGKVNNIFTCSGSPTSGGYGKVL